MKVLLICFFVLNGLNSFSQDFELPVNYELNVAADYNKYEKDMIAATNWLRDAAFDKNKAQRKDVCAFIFQWVSGSANVSVEIFPVIMDFEKKNAGMLSLYLGSAAKYVLQNTSITDSRAKQRAALLDMMKAYKESKGVSQDKKMDKLVKANAAGQLDGWMDDHMPAAKN